MNLEGKTIKSFARSEENAIDEYGSLDENFGKEEQMTITFTDDTSVVIRACVYDTGSSMFGPDARLSWKWVEKEPQEDEANQ